MYAARIYLSYFGQFLMARMSYKVDFIFSLFANILAAASGLLYILFLIDGRSVSSIQGWSRDEVLFIYGYSMVSMSIFGMFAWNLYQFGDRYIIQGQFDRVLLRPVNTLFQVLFESFNLDSLGTLITGLGVVVYSVHQLPIHFGFADLLWFILSSVAAGIIVLGVFVSVASISFHFEDRIGISAPIYNLTTFGRYPIPIFHRVLQFILSWILPFAFVAFFPSTHFLRREGFAFYCYFTPVMAVLTSLVASVAWKFGVSRYSSTGN